MTKLNGLRIFLFACVVASFAIGEHAQDSTVILKSFASPVYSSSARAANVSGDVRVLVLVHPDGTLASATVLSGHPMLKQAALDSAWHSIFNCNGCVADSPYLLVYKFQQIAGDDCCSASGVVPKIEQAAASRDQQGRPETQVAVIAEHTCLCDPAATFTERVRSLKCLYLWKCAVQLQRP